MVMNIQELLDSLYNNPANPAGFAGIERLWQEAKKTNKKIRKKDVEDYLASNRTYTLHKPRRIRFPRSKTIPAGYLTDLQCDLADFQRFSRQNNGNRYALVAIDVLSKRFFVVPVKSKRPRDMKPAFEQILDQMEMSPHRIFTDRGLEFRGKEIKKFFAEKDIEKYEANASTVKASLAERAIRTLKQRLYRYMSANQTLRWTEALDKIVLAINNSPTRALNGLKPIEVSFDNAREIWDRFYGSYLQKRSMLQREPKLTKDDLVRKSRERGAFTKGYLPTFSDDFYSVERVKRSHPNRYRIKELDEEKLERGYFYEPELARAKRSEGQVQRIERLIRTRKRKDGTKEYLVKFYDYKIPEWIDETHFALDPV
jgi:hypothetical protein